MKDKSVATSSFSDLTAKLQFAKQCEAAVVDNIQLYPHAINHVVNAHGKFYGLRSKYNGNGNLRQPMKATLYA